MLKKIKYYFIFFILLLLLGLNTISVSATMGLSPEQANPNNENFGATVDVYQDDEGRLTVDTSSKSEKNSLAGWWNKILKPYKVAITAIVGLATLTMLLAFVKLCIRLASCESHPLLREQTIRGMLLSGIACALLGSLTTYLAIISHIFA